MRQRSRRPSGRFVRKSRSRSKQTLHRLCQTQRGNGRDQHEHREEQDPHQHRGSLLQSLSDVSLQAVSGDAGVHRRISMDADSEEASLPTSAKGIFESKFSCLHPLSYGTDGLLDIVMDSLMAMVFTSLVRLHRSNGDTEQHHWRCYLLCGFREVATGLV